MRYRVDVHLDEHTLYRTLADDVRRGLTGRPKSLPPKYFYDAAGCALFERITRLPEYYLTRAEESIIRARGSEVMARVKPLDIVELGPGAATKTRRLLDAVNGAGQAVRYVPVDVDTDTVGAVARRLTRDYPFLRVHGVVGDFERHLGRVPPAVGERLVVFFGSTIGNLDPPARAVFLRQVRRLLEAGGRFLLGVDLVKDIRVLEAAYDDPGGVTREFNRNILRVVNRALDGDFRPEAFRHHACYNQEASRIEMHLIPLALQTVRLGRLDLRIQVSPDESIWTESSYKFTRESTRAMLEEAGLRVEQWYTDPGDRFALVLSAPA